MNQPVAMLPPSNEFAYFIGVFAGDGCITCSGRTLKLEISCDAAYPDLIVSYQQLVSALTGLKVAVYKARGINCFRVVAFSNDLPSLLGLPVGAKSRNGFAVPEWVFEKTEFVKMLFKGLIETDGTVARVYRHGGWYWHVHFSASHAGIMATFIRAAGVLGYTFTVRGSKAFMSDTRLTKQSIAALDITKLKEYIYS